MGSRQWQPYISDQSRSTPAEQAAQDAHSMNFERNERRTACRDLEMPNVSQSRKRHNAEIAANLRRRQGQDPTYHT